MPPRPSLITSKKLTSVRPEGNHVLLEAQQHLRRGLGGDATAHPAGVREEVRPQARPLVGDAVAEDDHLDRRAAGDELRVGAAVAVEVGEGLGAGCEGGQQQSRAQEGTE
jgi:hypothetical protein